MAETAVGFVIDYLTPLLTQEASLLRNVHSEVLDIKHELECIKCFFKEADMKAETEGETARDGVKAWVKQLTKVSFHIEDVIDEYVFHLAHHPRPLLRGGFIGFLYRFGRCIIKLKPRHQIASQIQDMKAEVCRIKERSARYGFDSISIDQDGSSSAAATTTSWYDPRKGALYLEEADAVGIESAEDELIGWLLDEQQTHQRTVISVVGMGGLGKTTLAKKVYDSVREEFGCHAWITVSQSYQKVELLKDIVKKFCEANKEPTPEGINAMDEETLTNRLREYLQQKRYVVIFDDVWSETFWGDMQHALLDIKNGSRIVITTRNLEVAKFHHLFMSMNCSLCLMKAWELFCNKAFQFESGGRCPTHLEQLSHKIVDKCGGLPLVIVSTAGLLSTKSKNTIDEWQKLHDSLSLELQSNPHLQSIIKILSLSYSDLPYHLKCCFLYFGMYPEDYSIRCSRLVRQWIAKGLIVNQKKDKTSEAIANEYLLLFL